jgi:hypothetical protein
MNGGLWVDVMKTKAKLVLKNDFGGNLFVDDFFKNGAHSSYLLVGARLDLQV